MDVVGDGGDEKSDGDGHDNPADNPVTAPSDSHQAASVRAEQDEEDARKLASPPDVCPTEI